MPTLLSLPLRFGSAGLTFNGLPSKKQHLTELPSSSLPVPVGNLISGPSHDTYSNRFGSDSSEAEAEVDEGNKPPGKKLKHAKREYSAEEKQSALEVYHSQAGKHGKYIEIPRADGSSQPIKTSSVVVWDYENKSAEAGEKRIHRTKKRGWRSVDLALVAKYKNRSFNTKTKFQYQDPETQKTETVSGDTLSRMIKKYYEDYEDDSVLGQPNIPIMLDVAEIKTNYKRPRKPEKNDKQ